MGASHSLHFGAPDMERLCVLNGLPLNDTMASQYSVQILSLSQKVWAKFSVLTVLKCAFFKFPSFKPGEDFRKLNYYTNKQNYI